MISGLLISGTQTAAEVTVRSVHGAACSGLARVCIPRQSRHYIVISLLAIAADPQTGK